MTVFGCLECARPGPDDRPKFDVNLTSEGQGPLPILAILSPDLATLWPLWD